MSRLAEFRKLEQQLAVQLAELESLKNDSGLQKEIEFEKKLRALLVEYKCSLRDVVNILDPQGVHNKGISAPVVKAVRRARTPKVYKNPHTGEQIETKGGNHKLLKSWKAEYGNQDVESWLAS